MRVQLSGTTFWQAQGFRFNASIEQVDGQKEKKETKVAFDSLRVTETTVILLQP